MRTLRKKKQYGKTAITCIIFFVTLFSSVSLFSMNTKAAGGTFDEASDEMNKIITITFMNKNQKVLCEGTYDVSETEGFKGLLNPDIEFNDEYDLIYYCARYMYNPKAISLDDEFEMSMAKAKAKGDPVYCKWTVANQTYMMSTLSKYSSQQKDGVLYLPNKIPQDVKDARSSSAEYKDEISKDLDYYNFPTFKSIQLATGVRFVVHGAADSIIGWISDKLGTSFDDIVGSITEVFKPDISYMRELLNTDDANLFDTSVKAFMGVGVAIAILIYLITLIGAMFGPLSGEENPLENIPRFVIALFLVILSDKVMDQLLSISSVFVNLFQTLGVVKHTNGERFLITGLLDVILVVIILKEFLQLMLEIIERYLVMMAMYIAAPLAFATYTSKKTSRIFSSFISMFFSQAVVYCITMWCINITLFLIEKAPDKCAGMNNTLEEIVYFFIIIGFLKIAQKIDSYLKDMGMTVAGTGANLGRAAMESMTLGYGMFRMGTSAYRMGKGALRTSGALHGSLNNTLFNATNGQSGKPTKGAKNEATLTQSANYAKRKIDKSGGTNADELKNSIQKFVNTGGKEGLNPNSVRVNGGIGSGDLYENGQKKKTLTWGADGITTRMSSGPKGAAQMPGMLSDAYDNMAHEKYGKSSISLEDAKISDSELATLGLSGIDKSKYRVARTPEGALQISGEGITAYSSRGASVPCSEMFQKNDLACLSTNEFGKSELSDAMFDNMYFQTSGPARDGGVVLWDNNGSVQELGYVTFNHSDVRGGRGIDLGYGEMGTITQVMHQDVANAYAEKICDRSESERIFKELGYDIDYDSINGNHESSVHNISDALTSDVYTELKDMNGSPVYIAAVKPGVEYIQRDGAFISLADDNLHRSSNSDITQLYVGRDKPRIIG